MKFDSAKRILANTVSETIFMNVLPVTEFRSLTKFLPSIEDDSLTEEIFKYY
jgi:hypothetical protein